MNLNTFIKRYMIIAALLLMTIVCFELSEKNMLENKALQANATPITNKTIVLDAGHGLPDEGGLLLHKISN